MPRNILISLLDGLLAGVGLASFIWLAYSRFAWKLPVGFGAIWMLISFVRLSMNSSLRRGAAEPSPGPQRAELELRKPSLAVTVCLAGILCVVGIIIRCSR